MSNEQRLVGTWIDENTGKTMVYNSDGTAASGGQNFKFGVTANRLAYVWENNSNTYVVEYSISTDGRTLITNVVGGNTGGGSLYRKRT